MWSFHIREYYSAIRQHEEGVTLENMLLSETNQTPKATCCMIPFRGNVQNRQFHDDRK